MTKLASPWQGRAPERTRQQFLHGTITDSAKALTATGGSDCPIRLARAAGTIFREEAECLEDHGLWLRHYSYLRRWDSARMTVASTSASTAGLFSPSQPAETVFNKAPPSARTFSVRSASSSGPNSRWNSILVPVRTRKSTKATLTSTP